MENEADKLVAMTRAKATLDARPQAARPGFSGRRFVLALMSALVVALMLMATVADTLWAAIELAYYRGAATNNAVFLEWATVREVNINGFEILCKRVEESDAAFHPIGSRIALGSATTGATYNFDVTSGLIPGERYCFRLREITTDATPGEAFDLCGYGLGLTPPPTTLPSAVAVEVSIPVTLTPTVVTVTQVPGIDAAPTLAPTVDPLATATPTIDPFLTPIPTIDPFTTATVVSENQGESPLPTPTFTATFTATITPTVTTDPTVQQQSLNPEQTEPPLEEPTPTEMPTEMPTATATPTDLPTATATLTTTIPVTVSQVGGEPVAMDGSEASAIPDNGVAASVAEATATPIYLVVTATPTPLPALVVAPTFTPWPTAAPTQTFGLSNLLVPNTQNLMVGLLCLIFVSASGLGALGLVTSVLYMRSQTRRDRLPGPVYDRRRY